MLATTLTEQEAARSNGGGEGGLMASCTGDDEGAAVCMQLATRVHRKACALNVLRHNLRQIELEPRNAKASIYGSEKLPVDCLREIYNTGVPDLVHEARCALPSFLFYAAYTDSRPLLLFIACHSPRERWRYTSRAFPPICQGGAARSAPHLCRHDRTGTTTRLCQYGGASQLKPKQCDIQ